MRHWFAVLAAGLLWTTTVQAQGLLVPTEKDLAPLAMVAHDVKIKIEDQAAVTHVTQTFRNPTSRQLEATYLFPIPKGAGVKKFTMWVDGKEVNGELVEADKARTIYTDVVRRLQDPGLLEYVGSNMLRLRVFPVPANGDQKVAVSFTSIASQENGLVEYCYPLKKGVFPAGGSPPKLSTEQVVAELHARGAIWSQPQKVQEPDTWEFKCSIPDRTDPSGVALIIFRARERRAGPGCHAQCFNSSRQERQVQCSPGKVQPPRHAARSTCCTTSTVRAIRSRSSAMATTRPSSPAWGRKRLSTRISSFTGHRAARTSS